MSSLAEAMIMASLFNNNNGTMFETRKNRSSDPFTEYRRFSDWQERKNEVKEKKEKEKKDKKPETPKLSYLEAVFWLFFLSPIIGPLWYNLENAIIKSMH